MNIEKCEDCEKDISKNALICPHCGGISRNTKKAQKISFVLLGISIIFFISLPIYLIYFFKPFGISLDESLDNISSITKSLK